MSERKLWCDGRPDVKSRYDRLLVSFVKHCDESDVGGIRDVYTCHDADGIPFSMRVHPQLYRKTPDGVWGDISRVVFEIDDDQFLFVVPREWIWPTGERKVHISKDIKPYGKDELFHQTLQFVEDYL